MSPRDDKASQYVRNRPNILRFFMLCAQRTKLADFFMVMCATAQKSWTEVDLHHDAEAKTRP